MKTPNSDTKWWKRINKHTLIAAIFCIALLGLAGCDPGERVVARTTNQAELARIALDAKHEQHVRVSACKKLTDQPLLAKIALEGKEMFVCEAAAEKLTDPSALAKVVLESKDLYVSRTALKKLNDPSLLANVAFKAHLTTSRIEAFDNIDSKTLAERSVSAKDPVTCRLASLLLNIRRGVLDIPDMHKDRLCREVLGIAGAFLDPLVITELGDVQDIKTKWEFREVRYYKPGKTWDYTVKGETFTVSVKLCNVFITRTWSTDFPYETRQEFIPASAHFVDDFCENIVLELSIPILNEVALKSENKALRRAATVELARQARAKFDMEDKSPSVRLSAVKKLTDQALLAKIAVETMDSDVRAAAVRKLTDQAVLAKIAVEDKDRYVRSAAANKLTDQSLLEKIAVEDKTDVVRYNAVMKLTDQAMLEKITVEEKDRNVRLAAAKKLTHQALLEKIAVADNDWNVRLAAVEKLTNQEVLDKIVVEDNEKVVRKAAVEKLTNHALLAKIAMEDKDWVVRLAAVEKLTDEVVLEKIAAEDKNGVVKEAARLRLSVLSEEAVRANAVQ